MLDQHGAFTARVHGEKFRPSLPDLFDLEVEIEALFFQQDPDFAGKRRETEMVQLAHGGDRKSVVWGKSVSVRVDLGGRRIIKNQNCSKTHTRRAEHIMKSLTHR